MLFQRLCLWCAAEVDAEAVQRWRLFCSEQCSERSRTCLTEPIACPACGGSFFQCYAEHRCCDACQEKGRRDERRTVDSA